MLVRATPLTRSLTTSIAKKSYSTKAPNNSQTPLRTGSPKDAKKSLGTENKGTKHLKLFDRVNREKSSAHFTKPDKFMKLQTIKKPEQKRVAPPLQDSRKAELVQTVRDRKVGTAVVKAEQLLEKTMSDPSKTTADVEKTTENLKKAKQNFEKAASTALSSTLYMNGKHHLTDVTHTAINRTDAMPAIEQLGIELRNTGRTADSLPAFAPVALYGDREKMFVANTHGLRESDIADARKQAALEFPELKKLYPNQTPVFRVLYLDVKMTSEHPTFGGIVKPGEEDNPIGQAMHIQTQFGFLDADENFTPLYTQESTGAANHPTGENAEHPSASFNGDHKNALTNIYPVRTGSKDGAIDLSNVTTYMPSLQGQNSNMFYAIKGGYAQQPKGLEYTTMYSVDCELTDKSATELLGQFLLAEKGGQVILSDEPVPITNKKYAAETTPIYEVISAGSFGQHAQSGGQFMCASTALDQMFGKNGIAFFDEGSPFAHTFQKPDTTYDVFTSMTLYAMSSETKNVSIRGEDGKRVAPEHYSEIIGEGTKEAYRQIVAQQTKTLQDAGKYMLGEAPETVFINGSGLTFPINLAQPGTASDTWDQMTPFLAGGRKMHDRYTPSQQSKDFLRDIGLGSTMLPEEREALSAYIEEMGAIYKLSDEAIERCLDKMPSIWRPVDTRL